MLRTLYLAAAVAAALLFASESDLLARGRGGCGGGGCGGGGGRCHSRGGCGSGGCGSGGCYTGGCGAGGCYTGGCATGGCGSIGGGCGGGVCAIPTAPLMMAYSDAEPATEARLVVALPADAVLSVDGQTTTSTSDLRIFRTPALAHGSAYSYTLRAEVLRDGQTVAVVRQVTVRPGQDTHVDLTEQATTVAATE